MSAKFVDYHSPKPGSALDMTSDVSKIALPSGAFCVKREWSASEVKNSVPELG
jgi:hypothetical protein